MGEAMVNGNSLYSNIHLLTAKSICLNILYRKRLSNIRWGKKTKKTKNKQQNHHHQQQKSKIFFLFCHFVVIVGHLHLRNGCAAVFGEQCKWKHRLPKKIFLFFINNFSHLNLLWLCFVLQRCSVLRYTNKAVDLNIKMTR